MLFGVSNEIDIIYLEQWEKSLYIYCMCLVNSLELCGQNFHGEAKLAISVLTYHS